MNPILVWVMGGIVLAGAVALIAAVRHRPTLTEPDAMFTLGLILVVIGLVLVIPLGSELALLVIVGVVFMAVGGLRMLSHPDEDRP
ncbi:MAG: hypothetical protein OEX04_08160 [Acidimicrobiia bacterium]|nr:hypothetical protein [Acidimicrobiia bacterium]MDH4307440.1 hypothetical protein [Acidimicrobiia bacterium]MDH5293807.1 hypothetical protein [Acidimicrobiia bacterium]